MGRRQGAVHGGCTRHLKWILVIGWLALLAGATSAHAAVYSWSGPVAQDTSGTGPGLDTLACASAGSCTALTTRGGAVTFAAAAPRPSTPASVDPSTPLASTCPTAAQCVSVDAAGQAVTFDPGNLSSVVSATIDPGTPLFAVACPAAKTCVAVDTTGQEITFTPGAPTASAVVARGRIDSTTNAILTAVSCFAAPTNSQGQSQPDCVAVDDAGLESTFNSTTGQSTGQSTIDYNTSGGTSSNALSALSCPSASQCLAFDGNGAQIQFDPSNFTGTTRTSADAGYAIMAADCPSTTQCTVIDSAGGEVTFAPLTNNAARHQIDATKSLTALACPTAGECLAVNGQGDAIPFDPGTGAGPGPQLIDAAGSYSAVGCASASQCTAADRAGNVVTFNPASGIVSAEGAADPSPATVEALACPSAAQCTLIDHSGTEATFDPRAPGNHTAKQLVANHPLLALACPSVTQCTAVDDADQEITFNPQAPAAATYAPLGADPSTNVLGIACPSSTQCTTIDGAGGEATFNPQLPGRPVPVAVLPNGGASISCSGPSQCVALGPDGSRATFVPADPGGATTANVDGMTPGAVACPTADLCLEIDTAEHPVQFDPHGSGATASGPALGASAVTGLACPSVAECVAVDTEGVAFVAQGSLPPVPQPAGAPRIAGRARQGGLLNSIAPPFSQPPTSIAIEWERCNPRGTVCRPIAHVSGSTYRLTAADVGHRLRVTQTPTGPAGTGAASTSGPTPVVAAVPMPASLSHVEVSLGRRGVMLRATIRAARFGPTLRRLSLTLPAGLLVGRSRTVRITLRRAVRTLRVTLRSPRLTISRRLRQRLDRRGGMRLILTLALLPASGRDRGRPRLHTTITFRSHG
jgi:hypothetical protein